MGRPCPCPSPSRSAERPRLARFAALLPHRERLSYATPVLLVLVLVVAVALVGGLRVALPAALLGALALDGFFTPPFGTLVVDGRAQLLALAADHAVVLDLGLPDLDGTEVLAGPAGWSTASVIVLSARDGQADKVAALDAGAVDFVTEPFGMDELLARLRAALRRGDGPGLPVIETASFTVGLAAKRATRGGEPVRLTPTEWHLLEVLARHPGRPVGQQQLLREVWGPGYEQQTQYLRVYVGALRRKLEPVPSAPRHLLTEPGMGYRLELRGAASTTPPGVRFAA